MSVATRTSHKMAGLRLRQLKPHPRLRWIPVLIGGSLLFVAVFAALLGTQDILYVPSLLLVGSAVVPITFITFVGGLPRPGELSFAEIAVAAALGGVIGTVVAGSLEFETVRTLGSLPTLGIGLIEESAKLVIPATLLLWRKQRPLDGLVLGVAVGSGFAALETMGYAFAALVASGGQLDSVTRLLLVRSVTEPGGHAAWTGLAAAALFAIRGSRRRWLSWLRFLSVFAGVVALHATWDSLNTDQGYLIVGGASFSLLMATTWHLYHDDSADRRPPRLANWLRGRRDLPEHMSPADVPDVGAEPLRPASRSAHGLPSRRSSHDVQLRYIDKSD
jgi:RsiW-degrading membrane proteinase PrsW (M82 family)